jgi:predicted phosphodiesterase
MAAKSEKSVIVQEYLDEYIDRIKEGTMSKLGLARLIYQDYTEIFKDVEEVRSFIRHYTGASGDVIVNTKEEHKFKSTQKHGIRAAIPESKAEPVADFVIHGPKKLLVFSDVHIPFHSVEALEVMFGYVQDIDGILINGDLLDFYGISRFEKRPDKPKMREEIEMGKEFFAWLRQEFKCPIYYKIGNHEERWEKYLISKAPEIFGMNEFRMEDILKLKEFDVQMIDSKALIKFGKLNIIHGHEMGESIFSPVNPARGLFLKAKCSTLAGHNHQTSAHHENNVNGDAMACWSIGCMCDLRPEYRPFAFTKWNHGFAVVELIDESGSFTVDNKRIIDGRVL